MDAEHTSTAKQYSAVDTFQDIGEAYQVAFDRVPGQVRSTKWAISKLPTNANCLDVGCGTGMPTCGMLLQAGHRVTGIDLTPSMLEAARKQLPKGRFLEADERTWEPPSSDIPYDCILSYFSWLAGVSQQDIHSFFRRAYKWLKPGGIFVFGTVTVAGEQVAIKWMGRDAIVSSLNAEDTLTSIKAAGFNIVSHEEENFYPKAVEAGICSAEEVWEEPHLFVCAIKPA